MFFFAVGPNVYHQVTNEDVNIAEAINFGSQEWLYERNNAKFCYKDESEHPVQFMASDQVEECKNLQDKISMKMPEIYSGPKMCPFCEKIFRQNLGRHIKDIHLKLSSRCKKCNSILSFYNLNRHMKNIHHSRPKKKTLDEAKKHNKWCHIGTKEWKSWIKEANPHICQNCGKSFSRKSNVKQHQQMIHIGEKHICQNCGKTFAAKRSLVRHNLTIHSRSRKKLFS